MLHERTSLLIIRVWAEDGSDEPLRASIRHTTDVSVGFQHAFTLTDADATAEVVRTWLRGVLLERRLLEADDTPEPPTHDGLGVR